MGVWLIVVGGRGRPCNGPQSATGTALSVLSVPVSVTPDDMDDARWTRHPTPTMDHRSGRPPPLLRLRPSPLGLGARASRLSILKNTRTRDSLVRIPSVDIISKT